MKPKARARDSLAALLRKTLTRPTNVSSTDLGSDDQLPKMSTLSPQQRRAMFAHSKAPPK
jgi:hypothetical protein